MKVRDLFEGWRSGVEIGCPVRIDDVFGRTLFKTYRDSDGNHDDNIWTPGDLDGGDDILDMVISRISAYDGDDDFSGGVLLLTVVDDD